MYKVKRFSHLTEQKEFGAVKKANRIAKKAWEKSEAKSLGFKDIGQDALKWVRSGKRVTTSPKNVHESIEVKNISKPLANVSGLSKSSQFAGQDLSKYRKSANGSLMKTAYDHGKPGIEGIDRINSAKNTMQITKYNKGLVQ